MIKIKSIWKIKFDLDDELPLNEINVCIKYKNVE